MTMDWQQRLHFSGAGRIPLVFPLALCLALFLSAWVRSEPFEAGSARIDITPPVGFPMWGYGARHDQPSLGARDPLHARAVLLRAGKQSLAIVSLDLGRAPTRLGTQRIRQELKSSMNLETIFLVASHTHNGPVLELDNWPTKERPYVRQLEEKIIAAVTQAGKNAKPARLGIVAQDVSFNRNRHWKRADPPVDREMLIVRIEDTDGKVIAHLVNFAAHPTMLPAKLREFSADYPGVLAGHVEKELGGHCLFLQGAAGDLSPNPPGEPTPESFGLALGELVVARSKKLRCDLAEIHSLGVRSHDFRFKSRIDIGNPLVFAAYSYAFFPGLVEFYKEEYRDGVRPQLTSALINGRVGLVGVSGEFFCSHSLQLKRRARLEHLLFLGYCNDYQQYFPTIEAAAEGGYGADPTVAAAEVGAGERIMDQALIDLLAMRGRKRLNPAK